MLFRWLRYFALSVFFIGCFTSIIRLSLLIRSIKSPQLHTTKKMDKHVSLSGPHRQWFVTFWMSQSKSSQFCQQTASDSRTRISRLSYLAILGLIFLFLASKGFMIKLVPVDEHQVRLDLDVIGTRTSYVLNRTRYVPNRKPTHKEEVDKASNKKVFQPVDKQPDNGV